MKIIKIINDQKGMVLIISLLFLVILTTVSGIALNNSVFDFKLARYYKSEIRSTYLGDAAIAQIFYWFNNPATFTDTSIGKYHPLVSAAEKGSSFFSKRRLTATNSYVNGITFLSQFADINNDGTIDTDADNPALEYDEGDAAQKIFLDTLFSSISSYEKITNLKIYKSSPINSDICTILVTIKSPLGQNIQIEAGLKPNKLFKLDTAVQSGISGTWNGNSALVHWSDINIMGNVVLPGDLDKTPIKNWHSAPNNNSYPGNSGSDAWLDIKASGTVSGPAGHDGDSQPYSWSAGHENIYQNQNIVDSEPWDYYKAKEYAVKYGTYYTSNAAGNIFLDGTGPALNFRNETKTNYGASKGYVFVDTINQLEPAADGSNLANISFSGSDYYTEGKFYIAANLSTNGLGNGETIINAKSPPYDIIEDIFGRDPTLTTDAAKRQSIAGIKANFNGAFYIAGQVDMQGGPNLFGGILAGRGFSGGGNPEIWYDYDLRDGDNNMFVQLRYWRKL